MRVPGYCECCHRFRMVRVRLYESGGGMAVGVCDECDE